ncbi:MAG TPA: LysM peptidoglycan-binding domain-containing protein [Burkholderiales bacterium]|nr:LysM peptidoglycan-binding domain-containing protein [Burkholderiales bacterium]
MRNRQRKSITTLVFVLCGLLAPGAFAQAPRAPTPAKPTTALALKPAAPDRYVVVPGDTLWGIAERFTDSPWRWPELWNMNREQIRNPHRIYPGDVIVIDRSRGRLALAGTTKLAPKVREESLGTEAIPSIAPNIIEPFLTRPLVVEPDGIDEAPRIVALDEGRVVVGDGGKAFVSGMGDSKEVSWNLYRRGSALIDPDTNTTLGYEAIYLGIARLVKSGEPATIELASVTQEIGIGDRLVPAGRPEIVRYAPRAPAGEVQGRVMSIYGGLGTVGEAGRHSIITLNRGRADGLELGHVLALHRHRGVVIDRTGPKGTRETVQLPDERYGLAFVFRVFDRVSYALVMNVSRPVTARDLVRTP